MREWRNGPARKGKNGCVLRTLPKLIRGVAAYIAGKGVRVGGKG